MRIGVQNPFFLFSDPNKDFNGVHLAFLKHCSVVYLPGFPRNLKRYLKMKRWLGSHPDLADRLEFVFTERELNRRCDALVCFNGYPIDFPSVEPPRRFTGLKVWHVFEYVFQPVRMNEMLQRGGVDYVIGYADHGRFCPFFRRFYSAYVDKVIPLPFGFAPRFAVDVEWETRTQKVVALGAVNPVNDPLAPHPEDLTEYTAYYHDQRWTHRWRRRLVENKDSLRSVMDSFLPEFPKTKGDNYDAVEMMSRYVMFANDEGLLQFPPARTFEGAAAGAVMVAGRSEVFGDLGFEHNKNCVFHEPMEVDDFKAQTTFYLEHPDALRAIAAEGQRMVRERFSHAKIAERLAREIETLTSP
jgi:hypothetical protein